MEKIKLYVSGNQIDVVEQPEIITAGTVGLEVEVAFDSQWEGLTPVAVFRAGDKTIASAWEQDVHRIPWEVLEKPNLWLYIGFYGANTEGTVVIPTCWAKIAVIHTSVDPEGDPAVDPANPAWQEALTRVYSTALMVNDHINDKSENPHNITCEQIGAAENASFRTFSNNMENTIADYRARISRLESVNEVAEPHFLNKENPHGVTCEQIKAVPEDAFFIIVNPLISSVDGANEAINIHLHDYNNPHEVTCEQIGAATKEELQTTVGDIETALDSILAIQNGLIGGDGV